MFGLSQATTQACLSSYTFFGQSSHVNMKDSEHQINFMHYQCCAQQLESTKKANCKTAV